MKEEMKDLGVKEVKLDFPEHLVKKDRRVNQVTLGLMDDLAIKVQKVSQVNLVHTECKALWDHLE